MLLIRSGTHDERVVAFALDVNPDVPAATLAPGQQVCQGPIAVVAPTANVILWVNPVGGPTPAATVTLRDYATRATLASGRIAPGLTAASAPGVQFNRTVRQGRTVSLCVRNPGPRPIALLGNAGNSHSGMITVAGVPQKYALAGLFIRPHQVSLLSQIPTVFRRAALFRPDWVGSWTFWVLAVLLVGAFGVAGYAVVQAEREDARSSEHTSAQ